MNPPTKRVLNTVLPLLLGGGVLYWMYRGFDFDRLGHVMLHEMNWLWMLLSFPFGILAQAIRGWRWRQTLEPMGEKASRRTCVHAVFVSYAASLLVPRIGEFTRCAVLNRKDGVSFPKAIGTVVTERAIDTLLMGAVAGVTLLIQVPVFTTFFRRTGTSVDGFFARFTAAGWLVTLICAVAAVIVVVLTIRRFSFYNKVRSTLRGIGEGIISLRGVRNVPLFLFYTAAIWLCYFLHYYLTFFCFEFTASLGVMCALVTFVVGSIAVIVPTPNGAGPWHFAVKTMLVLYGVADEHALYFVLIVHSVQTLLVVLLGIYGTLSLALTNKPVKSDTSEVSIPSGLSGDSTPSDTPKP